MIPNCNYGRQDIGNLSTKLVLRLPISSLAGGREAVYRVGTLPEPRSTHLARAAPAASLCAAGAGDRAGDHLHDRHDPHRRLLLGLGPHEPHGSMIRSRANSFHTIFRREVCRSIPYRRDAPRPSSVIESNLLVFFLEDQPRLAHCPERCA